MISTLPVSRPLRGLRGALIAALTIAAGGALANEPASAPAAAEAPAATPTEASAAKKATPPAPTDPEGTEESDEEKAKKAAAAKDAEGTPTPDAEKVNGAAAVESAGGTSPTEAGVAPASAVLPPVEPPPAAAEAAIQVASDANADAAAAVDAAPAKKKDPWAGSTITFRNVASAVSLDPGALMTYDPFYAMNIGFDPRWSFGEKFYVRGHFDVARELTRSNWTTMGRQYIGSDVVLGAGMSPVYKIPVADVAISADLGVRIPTSLASRATTMILGIEPSLRLSRGFEVLKGLSFSYAFSPWVAFNRYTTPELSSPVIPNACAVGSRDCERFLNAGNRNNLWGHSHGGSAALQIKSWLSVSVAAGVHVASLERVSTVDSVSFVPREPQNYNVTNSFSLAAAVRPTESLEIGLGASTFNPQLAPDGSRYGFAFNRFTNFFLDLRFEPGALVSQLRGVPAGDRH